MKVEINSIDAQNTVVALTGELDTLAAKDFAGQLEPAMNDAGKKITIDFTNLEYISSAGMRCILLLNKTAFAKGGSLRIKGMSDDIRQIFQMTGFDQMIEIL